MIVKCIKLYDGDTKQYIQDDRTPFVALGYHYNVLEVIITGQEVFYGLLADQHGMDGNPILVRSEDFEVVSANVPSNWKLNDQDQNHLKLSPVTWSDNSLWIDSFWEEYHNSTPRTLKCFEEELVTILSADKEYIAKMINERPNSEMYQNWHQTMMPVFNKVLEDVNVG